MPRRRAIIAVCTATIAVAAIGPSTATAHAQRSASKDIVETAAAGEFKTLTALLNKAGLARTLKGEGPYTVFAPTDQAFAKVPQQTLNALAKDKTKLRSVLLYHVAGRKLTAQRVIKRRSIKTLNGQRLRVRVRESTVLVGRARVVTPDVAASNGVIHVINRVLIPR